MLVDVTSGSSAQTQAVVRENAVPKLLELLHFAPEKAKEHVRT